MRNSFVEIDLSAIKNNVRLAKSKLKATTKLCAVVKADAYGHGAVPVANAAVSAGADYLAVAIVQEAEILRKAGITAPILILGTLVKNDVADVVTYDVEQAVYTEQHLQGLNGEAQKQNKKVKVHIAVDTGMSRIGVRPSEAGKFAKLAASMSNIEVVGVFSHFAAADGDDKSFAKKQFAAFQTALKNIEAEGVNIPIKHIGNSAVIQEMPDYQLDMVRQGITLYGLMPDRFKDEYKGFQPAMVFKSEVAYVKNIVAGECVGYGGTCVAKKTTKVATVPVGYADGFSRKLSNCGYMIIHGEKAPIIGRVCMDQCMLDVTDIADVQVGDMVIVEGGRELPFEEVAKLADTIDYELICLITGRVPRVYKEG